MRVLFSSLSGTGHFHPLVPTARALQKAGHEVAFAVPAPFQPVVEANGFGSFATGVGFETVVGTDPQEVQKRQEAAMRADASARLEMMTRMFVDGFTRRKLPDLTALCERWRPDLIVRESMDLAAALVGEKLGIPHASIQVGGGLIGGADQPFFMARLEAVRAEFGLKPDPELREPFRHLHLSFMPASYFEPRLPPTTRYLKLEVFDQSGSEGLPGWVSSLSGRPVVYATLGTAFNKLIHLLGTIAKGLQEEPVELIITVGRDLDPAVLGPQPAHVHVERYIPQSLLLPRCDLAIMHGGYNSVMSALYAGLPGLIMPIAADQPINAQACARIGLARVVMPDTLTPQLIRQQVREMLADGAYRERARRLQAEALALPGLEHGVALLERLAREKTLPAGS
ncbi:Dolichol-phosphate mannosyltransferase [Cystobacter fuscus DSM 2262]|uniref:Dolichol-phosphate mannosyltransferase n=1 Tax=Cystobacter fuscus (strain ATCC 25194 / DSM 2262 / NBRC 100088 / M29) TaxID=1242864 RepID=S9PJD8_CYSF2|nr:nucleotide disphospho-sugar-binding domain-containing protein [Cystobacter fuscus]EPX64410.1 Dolichol-phosphate mannosyltransferase [Cystobacter fuscus DSM 2262]